MNIINRYNYEEFFLLYVDGELTAAEKASVDSFLENNPDLLHEFQSLQSAILMPEEEISFNKSSLFKSEETHIHSGNYEGKFLLYVNEALNETEKKEVETFVLQHPALQDDFLLIKQTKLPLETIPCPDKDSLYKKERTPAFVFFMRVAAAAVIIGLGVILYQLSSNNISSTNSATVLNSKQTIIPTLKTNAVSNNKKVVDKSASPKNIPLKLVERTNPMNREIEKQETVKNTLKNNTTPTIIDIKQQPLQNETSVPIKDIATLVISENIAEKANAFLERNKEQFVTATLKSKEAEKESTSNTEVVYKELNLSDEKKTLAIGNVEINKDKLRGFLRKASKVLTKNKLPEIDNIAIASFAINK